MSSSLWNSERLNYPSLLAFHRPYLPPNFSSARRQYLKTLRPRSSLCRGGCRFYPSPEYACMPIQCEKLRELKPERNYEHCTTSQPCAIDYSDGSWSPPFFANDMQLGKSPDACFRRSRESSTTDDLEMLNVSRKIQNFALRPAASCKWSEG
jgi:hypothetical protein